MTITNEDKFYQKDLKEYEIKRNKQFLHWLKGAIAKGYHNILKLEEIQELINYIVLWYEIKYPERELTHLEEKGNIRISNTKSIANEMDINELLFRLPDNELVIMQCPYCAFGIEQIPIWQDGEIINWQTQVFMRIKIKKEIINPAIQELPFFLISANSITGEVVKGNTLIKYVNPDSKLTLDNLLTIFKEKYDQELDFTELEECIYNHHVDMELRSKILELAALKLLYSKNTTLERGYLRAKRLINEFNEAGLSLKMDKINESVYCDYNNKQEHLTKTRILTKK